MPSLLVHNKFARLSNTVVSEAPTVSNHVKTLPTAVIPEHKPLRRKPKWEQRLPRRYVLASTSGPKSLNIKVELQTTDTAELSSSSALIDSGATGRFISKQFVKANRITTRTLSHPIPVYNVDGTLNENGAITEVANLILRYKGHTERANFAVTSLGRQNVILGFTWLEEHNPDINWQTQEVVMNRCPDRCKQCRKDEEEERRKQVESEREEAQVLRITERRRKDSSPNLGTPPNSLPNSPNTCSPQNTRKSTRIEEVEDEEWVPHFDESDAEDTEGPPELVDIEDGDRIFCVNVPGEAEFIRASSNISQRLAEAAQRNFAPHQEVPEWLQDFGDVFSKQSFDVLPDRKIWDHAIELVLGSAPSNCKVYPLSPNEQKELDEFLEENLRTGRIRPSKSPMASPVFFIKKKDGSLRLVQDYRALNAITIKNRYPLPLISELVNQLRGAKYFTKLDVRWGYNNVRIKGGDEWKAAFRTNRGLFEPLVMFFGLTNSPATFQTMMNDIFRDLIAQGSVCVYLDDILIFTKTLEEHRLIVREVMSRLRAYKLYLKPEKCEFERTKVEYLGLIVSEGRVEMDPVKVAGVAEWPEPRNRKEVQSFLGFVNFYRRFIKDFSHIGRPLFDLTKQNTPWTWGEEQKVSFRELKDRVTTTPILIAPNDEKPYRVEADSSDFATGAILSQQGEDEKWHPIAFYSKSLSPVERNYEIHDKELLAIIRALEEWRHLLEGAKHPFEVWTDHKNLEYFRTSRKLNRRQARWSLYLASFDYTLHHKPGRSMGKADALSRRPDHGSGGDDNDNIVLLKPEVFAIRVLGGVTLSGEEEAILEEIKELMKSGNMEESVVKAAEELKRGRANTANTLRGSEWSQDAGLMYFRDRLYVPENPELRRRIVEQHHDTKVAGHPGRWKTLELVSRNYWWPNMSRYIGQYTSTCDLCLRTKVRRQSPTGELHPTPVPEVRWETISVDFIVELPEAHGHDAIMCVVDSLSKRAHFIPTHTTISSLGTARLFLANSWKLHGLPRSVISDRGPQFVSEFTRELYRLLGIQLATTTAYHPQADGQTERVNQELEQYLRVFVSERQDDWDELLPMAEFQYNNHVHSATKETPFMLDTGMHPRMGFEPRQAPSKREAANEFVERMKASLDEARSALAKSKDDMARYYDQRRTPASVFAPGDMVYLDASNIRTTRPSKKLAHRYLGPYKINTRVGPNTYRLELPESMKALHPVFNVVKLLSAPENPIPGRKVEVPLPPTLVDETGGEHYEIEQILDSRLRNHKLHFLVKWKGYGYEENQWIAEENLEAPELLQEFYQRHPGAPRRLENGQFATLPMKCRGAAAKTEGDVRGTPVRSSPRTRAQINEINTRHLFEQDYLALLA